MPAKPKGGSGNGKPVRRSARRTKQKSFGSDFEMDEPAKKRARKEPDPILPQPPSLSDPKPGTSADPVPDPEPDLGSPEKLKWASDPEHWRNHVLPTNHSERSFIFVSDPLFSEVPLVSSDQVGGDGHICRRDVLVSGRSFS